MATVPYGPGQGNPLNLTARLLPVGGWPAEGPHIGMTTSGTRQIRTAADQRDAAVLSGVPVTLMQGDLEDRACWRRRLRFPHLAVLVADHAETQPVSIHECGAIR
jgi:hypothetical protein